MAARTEEDKELFQKLKALCVPLLGNAVLTPSSIPEVTTLLSSALRILQDAKSKGRFLKPALISYVFFPISTILRRNPWAAIPDQLLEKLLGVLTIFCDDWWWDMDTQTWEQLFMLCGGIIGGMENKGKGKDRADETKEAAAHCLWSLLRQRVPSEDPLGVHGPAMRSVTIFVTFQSHSRIPKFVPIIGQTVDSLLSTCQSLHLPLARTSTKLLQVIVAHYLADDVLPSVMPGIVSSMCKVALAVGNTKTWANGDIVGAALEVLQETIVRGIGDVICIKEGAVVSVDTLEDLVELETQSSEDPKPTHSAPYATHRTKSWLRGTSSQLHMALISLKPLVNHPTSSALLALCTLATSVLDATPLTLPQSQPLLLSWLLSLMHSDYAGVSTHAKTSLLDLLNSTTSSRHSLTQVLLQISKEHLAALPRLLPSHSDARVEHSAKIVEAICALASEDDSNADRSLHVVGREIGRLLGPNGGIERWGWSLLSVLTFSLPHIVNTSAPASQLMLEGNSDSVQSMPFPEITLLPLTSRAAQDALERMFRAMGNASGEEGLYAAEWFLNVGKNRQDNRAIAGLWCACRLLEGIGHISLDSSSLDTPMKQRRKKLERFVRGIAKTLPEMWDENEATLDEPQEPASSAEQALLDPQEDIVVEHTKGLIDVRSPLDVGKPSPVVNNTPPPPAPNPVLRKVLALQVLAVCAGILQARYTPLLLDVLYPILHSLVSDSAHLSSTALSALHYITHSTSYASPANLLLSNFDYALDSVSRRLNRRWLDIDAPRVLVVLTRLVGRDVVQKAGDIVEECFDRLDEYHGYEILVDGLVAVLLEVVLVVGADEQNHTEPKRAGQSGHTRQNDSNRFNSFFEWFNHRHDEQNDEDEVPSFKYSEVPHKAWGDDEDEENQHPGRAEDPAHEVPPTPTQSLTKQIVSRSLYFLTHGSPLIRTRILNVLTSSVPVLPESALLPSIHQAWPFILNRMGDPEPFVVAAAVSLIEVLADRVGDFMHQRVWNDVWPRFQTLLTKLEAADSTSALARRGPGSVGTESAYTVSHRLYKAMIGTMKSSAIGVQAQDTKTWEVTLAFRRFLHNQAHEELQSQAKELYRALSTNNPDAVWLALSATAGEIEAWSFLHNPRWTITANAQQILQTV